ncbi:MAG: FAD:protein FMN transferase [Butyricicoccus sp.]
MALTHVGYQNVKLLGNNQVQLLNGAQVDLGGIGKGYAGDIVHEMAESDTSDQWHVLARLSGNIEMYGAKPQTAARTTGTSALPIRTTTRIRLRWCRCVTARLLPRAITSAFLRRTANATTTF